ncbi:ankyrin unc44 [Fusarium albosuccineum]|uniref:Ankyrin unc44 n=1 Tax=Fusarium albosuccineum TaxID=1237068 RepID=A0A8H4P565_9HYPO|nr:ankyrin unc44 [Fusarium albosuccineum]
MSSRAYTPDDEVKDGQSCLRGLLLKMVEDKQLFKNPDLDELRKLLDRDKSKVNARDPDGQTPLHLAAEHGLVKAAKVLIKVGANISAKDKNDRQPLHMACLEGQTEMARLLLQKGADIEARQCHQATPLDEACSEGHIDVVNLLLNQNANIQVKDESGWSPLHTASGFGHNEVVQRLLISNKSNINATEPIDGWTPLHAATYFGHSEVVLTLHENGAALDSKDNEEWTPLMTATRRQHADIMKILLTPRSKDEDIQLETRDETGHTPLLVACQDGFLECACQLIAAGANCNAHSLNLNNTPLILASFHRHREIVKNLLNTDGQTDVDAKDTFGWTALHCASYRGHTKVVQLLLDQANPNIDAAIEEGSTALHLASRKDNGSVVRLLLEATASVDAKDKDSMTALHIVSSAQGDDRVQLDPDEVGPDDLTPEERCNIEFQSGRHCAVVQLLLNSGAKPGARNKWNETALHLAARCGDPDRLQLILEGMEQEDLLSRNREGQTALYSAFTGYRPEIAMKSLLASDMLKIAEFGPVDVWESAVEWAVRDLETYDIAKWLFRKRPRGIEAIQPPLSENWSLIEWAAHEQLPRALYLLISNSSGTDETEEALESALMSTLNFTKELNEGGAYEELPRVLWLLITASDRTPEAEHAMRLAFESVKKFKNQPRISTSVKKLQDISTADPSASPHRRKSKSQKKRGGEGKTDREMQQTGPEQMGQKGVESEDLDTIEDILRDPPFAQMHRASKRYELPRPKAGIGDIPERFEATVVYKGKDDSETIRRYRSVQEVIYDTGPTRILKNATTSLSSIIGKGSGLPSHMVVLEAESKFTWVHLPSTNIDWMNDLLTRIMKDGNYETSQYQEVRSFFQDSWVEVPDRTSASRIMRPRAVERRQERETEATKPDKDSAEKERRPLAASAIYMPYFCFSTQCPAGVSLIKDQKFREAKENYESLLEAYERSVIHGSPTLDEWYYHFATDGKSTVEKNYRNETQVVTKFLEGEKHEPSEPGEPSQFTLLRVNQLWVWAVDDNSSHDRLVEGILDQLRKQGSQPGSVFEMINFIVDYCISSYERRPKPQGQVSIGQTFSHYMNGIGRDETSLFEDFSRRTQSWQQRAKGSGERNASKVFPPGEGSPKNPPGMSPDDEIRKAIKKAEKLYCDIKDVRDELNILKSAAQYQRAVQRGLAGDKVKDADLSATYVVNDIAEMDIVAHRIQSAQSEIANFQAALAAKQASLATDQGKILMAFTFATLLFLPLSFLSSLFALDVNSFQQTPGWAFAVIFLVAATTCIILVFLAIHWNVMIPKLGAHVSNVFKKSTKTSPNALGGIVAQRPKKESTGEGGPDPPSEHSAIGGGSFQQRFYHPFRDRAKKSQQSNV